MSKKVPIVLFLLASILAVQISGVYDSAKWFPVPTLGSMAYGDISTNSTNVIGVNKLQFGFQLDFYNTVAFGQNAIAMQMARDCNFKIVRAFDWSIGYGRAQACTYWNDTSKTGIFNWKYVDIFVNSVYAIGAEPLIVLGMADMTTHRPAGMGLNPSTNLPYVDSFAEYCACWVRHLPNVKYWEIDNEADVSTKTKILNFIQLFNAAFSKMKSINPNASVSFDKASCPYSTQNYPEIVWLNNGGGNIDSIDYHQYNSGSLDKTNQYYGDDQAIFSISDTDNIWCGNAILAKHAQDTWYARRGKVLPIINSECNLNSAFEGGTDARNNQICGAVWLGITLRQEILNGVSYHIHFALLGSKSYETSKQPYGGYGFGMIDSDTNQPYFPYCLYKILGTRLSVGDSIIESNCTYDDIRVLSWIHDNKVNVLLIHKATNVRTLQILPARNLEYFKLEDPTNTKFINAQIQSGMLDSSNIVMNGYSIVLLQVAPERNVVDIYDALLLSWAFNSRPGDPNWNIAADLNKDNVIDVYDIILLAGNFGKTE